MALKGHSEWGLELVGDHRDDIDSSKSSSEVHQVEL
jgi:hypothetical protein